MDLESERLERTQLETLSTPELIRHALSETRLLVKAEVMHAKKELKQELQAAKTAGILLGAGAVLALTSLAVLFVALGLALPLGAAVGVLIVGAVLLLVAGLLLFLGTKRVPKQAMPHTQERLKADLKMTRETLQ
ncbi:phage holin family protein [Corallococcus sp. CA053C]|uniref:phage holin family protein n=1 Tax=Corallococcus sp. CA053C TaxID=2316732 RepID=UPI000EA16B32|nr:phage holin family protein [Corallococcus sp. CA053C]RKG95916.1 phage holin family protein [Corallococcus sp. CA053C]